MNDKLFLKASEYFYKYYSNPTKILEIKEDISYVNLNAKENFFFRYVYNLSESQFNIALKQYLIATYYSLEINKAIMLSAYQSNSKHIILMPNEWINFFEKKDVIIRDISIIFFKISLFKIIIKAFINYFLAILASSKIKKNRNYVFFSGINSSCLPKIDGNPGNFNIINWFLIHNENCHEIRHSVGTDKRNYVFHNTEINYQKYPFGPIYFRKFLKFSIWFFVSLFLVILAYIFGKWKFVILFSEAVLDKRCTYSSSTATEYIFNLSHYIYRPLWTYNKKFKVTMLSYSSSFHQFKTIYGQAPAEIGYNIMSWPEISVFTNQYCLWLRSKINTNLTNVRCVSPIWFRDSNKCIESYVPKNMYKNLAVFDVTPMNKLADRSWGSFPLYRTFENAEIFLNDIYDIASELRLNVLFKAKRDFGKFHDERYIKFLNEYCKRDFVYRFPSDTSPVNLARFSNISVSAPFTSTAFMMGNLPSAFYDPQSIIFKDDPGAQGKLLLSSKEELREWLVSNYCN